jgi:hypothetical protein
MTSGRDGGEARRGRRWLARRYTWACLSTIASHVTSSGTARSCCVCSAESQASEMTRTDYGC